MRWIVKVGLLIGIIFLSSCSTTTVLFDGKSLQGWNQLGDANWNVQDGVVSADRGEGYLVSLERYSTFVLEVEFTVDPDVNSGLFVHCQDDTEITPLNCYEINIWDNHPNQSFRTGAIVTQVSPLAKLDTVGQWNRYRIVVTEEALDVSLNGIQVAYLTPLDKRSGMIALQHIGDGAVQFRRLTIESSR